MASTNKVALDTNALTAIYLFKARVFEQIREEIGKTEFAVPRQVLDELGKLAERNEKLKRAAKIAKELMEKNKVKVVEVEANNADDALLKLSKGAIIATNDKRLKKKIIEKGGRVFFLRQKKFLEINERF